VTIDSDSCDNVIFGSGGTDEGSAGVLEIHEVERIEKMIKQ
jgi:hypothetical protein